MRKKKNGFDVNYSTSTRLRRVHVLPLSIHLTTLTFFLSREKMKNVGDTNFCGNTRFLSSVLPHSRLIDYLIIPINVSKISGDSDIRCS